MAENTVKCPKCSTIINLDEIQAAKYNEELRRNEEKLKLEFTKREEEIKRDMWIKAQKAADEKKQLETADLKLQLGELQKKQDEAIKNELELRRKARELEDRAKNIELENARKLDEEKKRLEEQIVSEQKRKEEDMIRKLQEDQVKQLAEKDKQLDGLRKSLDEANRKALQGSQQIQGEIQENEIKQILTRNFPHDTIEDVPTGIKGADLIHTVHNQRGQKVGVILWESKNTKAWSNDWIKKLKDDRVIAKADVCVIVTSAMPEDIRHFGLLNDVWVTELSYFLALTVAIRDKLISLSQATSALVGKDEKMELLYNYLSSIEFKSKIENIIEAFRSMKEDLEGEKRSMARIWSKREKELERIINNTSFLYGDMQGIMGNNLQKIQYLELGSGNTEE